MFEVHDPKLPHYVLPTYPALALVTAMAVTAGAVRVRGVLAWLMSLGPVLIPALILLTAGVAGYHVEGTLPLAGLAVLAVGAAVGVLAWRLLLRDQALAAVLVSLASAAIVYPGAYQLVLPRLDELRISERLVQLGSAAAACAEPELAA